MKKAIVFSIFIFTQTFVMAQTQPKLLYFGDPMCSWCYGFSPEFSKVVEALEGEVDVQLVMGGLRPYGTETMADLGDFLKHHWEEVGQRSGQPFQFDILQKTEFVYDTEPACRAVVAMRGLQPESEFEFFKAVQRAFYFKNKNTNETSIFVETAGQFGVDKMEFEKLFLSEEMKQAVRQDFEFSQELGIRSFPTVVLQVADEFFLLANGYTEADDILKKIKQVTSR